MSVTVSISLPARGHVSVRDRVRESMSVTEFVFVTVSVTLSVSVVVPVTSSARGWGRNHVFERVTVRVAACTFSVVVSMHNHASVRASVNVRFRVRDHVSFRDLCRARIHGQSVSVVVSEAVLVVMPVSVTVSVSMSVPEFMFVTVFVSMLNR